VYSKEDRVATFGRGSRGCVNIKKDFYVSDGFVSVGGDVIGSGSAEEEECAESEKEEGLFEHFS